MFGTGRAEKSAPPGCGSASNSLTPAPTLPSCPRRYMVVVSTTDRNVHSEGEIISVHANDLNKRAGL